MPTKFLSLVASALLCAAASAQTQPHLDPATHQLLVEGHSFTVLGGELSNSASGTAEQADSVLPNLAALHLNTVLVPVAWETIEPAEGHFDFAVLDHWITVARANRLHLIPLWFGSWKNSTSGYTPGWVKRDVGRFPRAVGHGQLTETLSPFGEETLRADERAFAALMKHLAETDAREHTVLMVQVENEVGLLNDSRERTVEANRIFAGAVPAELLGHLKAHAAELSPELAAVFHPSGRNWREAFGERASEAFTAWQYGRFLNAVAAAGKKQYALPMFTNAQLPAPAERAGEYPAGGPHQVNLAIFRAAAPAIDFLSPDIYWPNFEFYLDRYAALPGNAVFVPEARLDAAPFNVLYALGQDGALGFSPFNIDSLKASDKPALGEVYAQLATLSDLLPAAQREHRTAGLVLHKNSPRATQTVALGGYLFHAVLSRSWPTQALATDDGAMMIVQTAPDDFLVLASGLSVTMTRDPDTDSRAAGIVSIDEVSREGDGALTILRHLNGDETNQNHTLLTDATHVRLYHLRLYSVAER